MDSIHYISSDILQLSDINDIIQLHKKIELSKEAIDKISNAEPT